MKKVKKQIGKIFSNSNKPSSTKKTKEDDTSAPDFTEFENEVLAKTVKFTMTGPDRIVSLIRAVEYIVKNKVKGDIVECGVWKGGSVLAILHSLNNLKETRNVYLFDTFEGMTYPTDEDFSIKKQVSAKEIYKNKDGVMCYSSIEEVKSNLKSVNYSSEYVHFIKGKVEDTIPNSNTPEKIALLRLDTDWYESTKHEMEHLFPRLEKGGIIIIDDYGHWSGCKKAVDEYLEENNISLFLARIDYTCRIGVKM